MDIYIANWAKPLMLNTKAIVCAIYNRPGKEGNVVISSCPALNLIKGQEHWKRVDSQLAREVGIRCPRLLVCARV